MRIFFILTIFLLLAAPLTQVNAAGLDGAAGCDADFFDYMETRAWMEAQREVELAGSLIKRSASVSNAMNSVLALSKCENINDGLALTLSEMGDADIRGCGTSAGLWSAATDRMDAGYTFDVAESFLDMLEPDACGSVIPVPTGLSYEAKNSNDESQIYEEKTCLAAGCIYNREKDQCQ